MHQALVSGTVSISIINSFEMIEVEQNQRNAVSIALGKFYFAIEPFFESSVVVKRGQRISHRLVLDLLEQPGMADGNGELIGDGLDHHHLFALPGTARSVFDYQEAHLQIAINDRSLQLARTDRGIKGKAIRRKRRGSGIPTGVLTSSG